MANLLQQLLGLGAGGGAHARLREAVPIGALKRPPRVHRVSPLGLGFGLGPTLTLTLTLIVTLTLTSTLTPTPTLTLTVSRSGLVRCGSRRVRSPLVCLARAVVG